MLTSSYARDTNDPHLLQAMLLEWSLRELAYRKAHPELVPAEERLAEMVPARDAGDVCGVCGEIVTWVDHLPGLTARDAVRCMVNVAQMPTKLDIVIDDIFPRV
jgi:hypothetical protein